MNSDRRTFLRTVGAGCASVLAAGCSEETPEGEPTDTPTDEPSTDTPTSTPTATATEDGVQEVSGDAPVVISMEAGGADIWDQNDLGHFFYTQVSGDFDVSVEVTSLANTNPHAKAGIMARADLESGSRNIMARNRAGFGTSVQWRPTDGTGSTSTTSEEGSELSRIDGGFVEDAPWQRLQRVGDTIRAYTSTNGEDWQLMVEVPAAVIELPDEVYIGLAATSHDQAELTTAKFRNWEGPDLSDNQDLGNPIMAGSVSVTQSAVVAALEPSDVAPSSATLRAELEHPGGAEEVSISFEYREVTESEWTTTDAQTISEAGTVEFEVSELTPRRYYEFSALADDGENQTSTVVDLFSTPSGSDGSSEEGPRSNALHDMADGFADPAPWLDDDTPIIKVREPTREALSTATGVDGPRVVVFETSGTIDLGAQNLNVRNDKCWIAGQTAPSPGITLIRGGVWIYGDDSVVQHVRVRPGNAGQETGWQPDAIEIADDAQNVIVDHCTGTWSIDENINSGYDTVDTTISNCLVSEPLNDSTHPKGEHGYNTIIGNRAKNVALMGNVWAYGVDRNPRLKQGCETVIVNNLVHHFNDGAWVDPDTAHSIVGNVWQWPQSDQPNVLMKDGSGSPVYAEDNVMDWDADNPMIGDQIRQVDSRPLWPEGMEAAPSGEVYESNLANAGARPADRTEHDERIVQNIRDAGGSIIDDQEEVGGYPDLAENTHELEIPESGLRAWIREQALAVETN